MLWAHKGTVCGFESHPRHWPTPDIFCSVILAVLPVLLTETERSDSMPKKKSKSLNVTVIRNNDNGYFLLH